MSRSAIPKRDVAPLLKTVRDYLLGVSIQNNGRKSRWSIYYITLCVFTITSSARAHFGVAIRARVFWARSARPQRPRRSGAQVNIKQRSFRNCWNEFWLPLCRLSANYYYNRDGRREIAAPTVLDVKLLPSGWVYGCGTPANVPRTWTLPFAVTGRRR